MASRDPRRPQLEAALSKARAAKADLLHRNPSILRKRANSGRLPTIVTEPSWYGLPSIPNEVAKTVHEAKDRAAEERRLAPRSGRARRY